MRPHEIIRFGEGAILLRWRGEVSSSLQQIIWRWDKHIRDNLGLQILETSIGYKELAVFVSEVYSVQSVIAGIKELPAPAIIPRDTPSRKIVIPVSYGGEYGPDLGEVARHNELTEKEVISFHSESEYMVHFLGFLPGFPYLGGLNKRLHTPRRSSPRPSIPSGSVGIGGVQTGIYPQSSPGGWQLIGRTPIALFDDENEKPALLRAGDILLFEVVTDKEYNSILRAVDKKEYSLKVIDHGN